MRTILVINSKGGSGKTTLSTNLASYYARKKFKTAIIDYDPQGSSLNWLRSRPNNVEKIHAANGAARSSAPLRSAQMWIPEDTEILIVDAPAGAKGLLLQDLVRKSHFILIPVAPSSIDIHATADFVKELFLFGGARHSKAKIAVVANRVRKHSAVYESLERFLHSLKLPFLTRISDSQNYLHAVEKGLGIFEMDEESTVAEREELMPIFMWVEGTWTDSQAAGSTNIVSIDSSGKFSSMRTSGKSLLSNILSATGRFKNLP
ncbi:MAG TPA: ParA family protein [Gallionella sp.]